MSTLTYRGTQYQTRSNYNELLLIRKKLKQQEKEIQVLKQIARAQYD